jgi:hypothetical protein
MNVSSILKFNKIILCEPLECNKFSNLVTSSKSWLADIKVQFDI